MPLTERQATIEDLPRLLEIEQSAFPPGRWASESSLRDRIALFGIGSRIAFSSDIPAAFANGFPISKRSTHAELSPPDRELFDKNGSVWFLRNVAVHKQFQKKGLGKFLISKQIALAREFNARHFRFTATMDLTAYYAALGFKVLQKESVFHGVPQTVWDMQL